MEKLIGDVANVIKEAAKSPLGIMALMILALSNLAFAFFREADELIRIYSFCIVTGFFLFLLAILHATKRSEVKRQPWELLAAGWKSFLRTTIVLTCILGIGLIVLGLFSVVPYILMPAILDEQTSTDSLFNSQNANGSLNAPRPRATKVIARSCVVREHPTTSASVLGVLPAGSQLLVSGLDDGWRRVQLGNGLQGWTGPSCWI